MHTRNLEPSTRRSGWWWSGAARGVGVMMLVTGCAVTAGGSGLPAGTAPRVTSDSSNPSAAAGRPAGEAADPAAVTAAYRRLWVVAETISGRPPALWHEVLSTVAAEPLLTQLTDGYRAQRDAGRRDYGTVVPQPSVVAVDGGRASVLDCQDASRSGELDLDTGLPRTVGHARTPLAGTLTYGADRRWRVSQLRYLDGSC